MYPTDREELRIALALASKSLLLGQGTKHESIRDAIGIAAKQVVKGGDTVLFPFRDTWVGGEVYAIKHDEIWVQTWDPTTNEEVCLGVPWKDVRVIWRHWDHHFKGHLPKSG